MTDPCDLTITRQTASGAFDFIRIEAKDGAKTLARLDMSLADFTAALLGDTVIAAVDRALESLP